LINKDLTLFIEQSTIMLLLLLASLIWGTSFPIIGLSLKYFSP